MSVIHLTGFLEDTIFQSRSRLSLAGTPSSPVGQLDSLLIDYFSSISRITDTRTTRRSLLGASAVGVSKIIFDLDLVENKSVWATLSGIWYDTLFSIAEIAYLAQDKTVDDKDYILSHDTGTKDIYISKSLVVSTVTAPVTTYSPSEQQVEIPNWVEFQVYLSADQTDILKIRLWLNNMDFKSNYPYTTITRVVPPRDPALLFAPTASMSEMQAVITGSQYTFGQINTDLYQNDQTGLLIFKTKYLVSVDKEYQLPFGVIYRGPKEPTTMACRAAIKQFLMDTGLTTEDNLRTLFPELFVELQFFLVPLWDYHTKQADRIIYPSISPVHSYVTEELKRLYPNMNDTYPDDRITYLLNAYNDMWLVAIPDELNHDTTSLVELHPTYNNHSSSQVEFRYMDTLTRQFATKLIRCMATLHQELATDEFNTLTQDGRTYLSFTIGRAEYQVMTKDSYLAMV